MEKKENGTENEAQTKEGFAQSKEGFAQSKEDFAQSQKEKWSLKNFIKNQKKSLPLKMVILCYSGGAICIFPFLVLQMQQLGLTINEIAVMYLIIPFGSLLGPIISGMTADKIGQYKLVYVVCAVMGAITCNMLLIIPRYEQSKIYLNCDLGQMSVNYSSCNECISKFNYKTSQTLNLKNCQPCNGNEKIEFNCSGNSFETFKCPVFDTSKDIEITLSLSDQNSSCVRMVNNYSQSNTTSIDEKERCTKRESCDYKCDIPDSISECFPQPLLTDTFILTSIVSFAANFFIASSFIMLDATILQYVKEHNASIGKQKIMHMVGFAFAPLLAGQLIDMYSKKIGHKSFFPAFMMSDVLMLCACLFTYSVDMTADKNKSSIFRDLGKLVTALEVDLFLLLVLILGCNFGFIESYLFIYLQSLGAPSLLLGLTMTVGCLSSIPMLFCADWLDKKLGRHKIFLICFTAYAIRMIGYSFIRNPWMCLIFESLEAITYQLMWVTCLKLCPLLAPKGMLATMTGLAGSIHYSFGKGIGGFLGGRLIDAFGIRVSFRIFGGLALCGGIFYLIIHYTYFKKKIEIKEKEMAEADNLEKREEEKKMLSNGIDKCPSYNELSMDLQHTFLASAGPPRKFSIDGPLLGIRRHSKTSHQRKSSKIQSESHINFSSKKNTMSTSVPFLYNAGLYETLANNDPKQLSKSMNNIKA